MTTFSANYCYAMRQRLHFFIKYVLDGYSILPKMIAITYHISMEEQQTPPEESSLAMEALRENLDLEEVPLERIPY